MENQKVVNFNQAISVLLQAADMGRTKGIFDWEDLELVGQAIKFIKTIQEQAKQEKVDKVDIKDNVPAPETKPVILETSKD